MKSLFFKKQHLYISIIILITIINIITHINNLSENTKKISSTSKSISLNNKIIEKKSKELLHLKSLQLLLNHSFDKIEYNKISNQRITVIIHSENLYKDLQKITSESNKIQQNIKSIIVNLEKQNITLNLIGIK